MGQTVSKVTKSVVSKSRTFGKDPTSSVAATATPAATSGTAIDPNSPSPPQHQQTPPPPRPFISDEVAASYPSPPDHRDAVQRRFLEEKAGSLEYREMPQDLVDFLKNAGPLQQRSNTGSGGGGSGDTAQERKLRLPRHLRDQDSSSSEKDGNEQQHPLPSSSSGPERHIESMRLAENIPGFETSRSTNFSTRAAANDNDDPTIFQAGQVLDIYDMIMLLRQRKESASSSSITTTNLEEQQQEEVVQEIYQQYAKQYAIPEEDTEQERHRELLRKTLAYLEVPVIMKDTTDGSYDGVRPEQVSDFTILGGMVMPPTSVKNVLQDFSDIRKKEREQ